MENKKRFLTSSRPHIVMITTMAYTMAIIPGLPDRVEKCVCQPITDRLAKQGYKITLLTGGLPAPCQR
jgi:hypothetical protein